jgi:alkylation response protein AidB-like acyl-CoA dehydrogenase
VGPPISTSISNGPASNTSFEYPIAQMWADARVQPIYGGANEIMKEIIARSL